jgi:hypothetical protein
MFHQKKARSILDQILSSEIDNLLEEEPQVAEANSLPDIPSTSAIPSSKKKKKKFRFLILCLISNLIFFPILEM